MVILEVSHGTLAPPIGLTLRVGIPEAYTGSSQGAGSTTSAGVHVSPVIISNGSYGFLMASAGPFICGAVMAKTGSSSDAWALWVPALERRCTMAVPLTGNGNMR